MSVNLEIKISPKYKVSDFIEANEKCGWEKLVEIFSDRLDGRYLKPIELILNGDSEISEFSGFSILALDCILIETLNQFYNGINETPSDHQKTFREFFSQSPFFKELGSRKKSEVFYAHFRCGLIHQAQTKKQSLIRIGQDTLVTQVSGKLKDGLIIDRRKFHDALQKEIDRYKEVLTSGDEKLRINFIRKMKYICNIPQEKPSCFVQRLVSFSGN